MNITIQADKPEEPAVPAKEPEDAAALAFELLREEVALCRRAVAGLAAERAAIQIPDYSKTLNQMAGALNTMSGQLNALLKKPALALTPQQWTYQIATAGNDVRRRAIHARSGAGGIRRSHPGTVREIIFRPPGRSPGQMADVGGDRRSFAWNGARPVSRHAARCGSPFMRSTQLGWPPMRSFLPVRFLRSVGRREADPTTTIKPASEPFAPGHKTISVCSWPTCLRRLKDRWRGALIFMLMYRTLC